MKRQKTDMKTLKAFSSGDGAHCGLSDWYPDKEKALRTALKSGKPFDTGWYGSKKEIASARISSEDGKQVFVEVSVSDDFDTEGGGRSQVFGEFPVDLEQVREAISRAWSEAEENQKENREYAGYSVLHYSTEIPDYLRSPNVYPRETRKRYARKQAQCLDIYLVNVSQWGAKTPPGDEYHFWGWQSDPMHEEEGNGWLTSKPDQGQNPDPVLKIPKEVQEAFEDHAQSLKKTALRIGDWEIKPWDDE
jgi:hypothetical protein